MALRRSTWTYRSERIARNAVSTGTPYLLGCWIYWGESMEEQIGHYRLDTLLGRGGMGEVYKAWDQRLERWVAAKHLLPGLRGGSARLWREARAAARLGHPAIVQVFDVLEHADGDWIVMEWIDGETLAEILRQEKLPVERAVSYFRQVASGLEAAHASGIVHRDLKAENVMVLPSGHVKILDFGLARPTTQEDVGDEAVAEGLSGQLTVGLAGTPRVMSPEQARQQPLDSRSDLFSLGVLAYELLTASSPFRASSVPETLERVQNHDPAPTRDLNPQVPEVVDRLVNQLLEKDRQRRPASAAAVVDALASLSEERVDGKPSGTPSLGGDEPTPALDGMANSGTEGAPAKLRVWPDPPYPETPYPVLLPYNHPELFAGREQELDELRRLLRMPIPILGLYAPSGAGKSSLLGGGLVPALRGEGAPVAQILHPGEAGIANKILGDLLEGTFNVTEDDWRTFVRSLELAEQLAGTPPLIVLDQFEELFRPGREQARNALALLLAGTVRRRPGDEGPRCRWVLAYRQETHGEVLAWLANVFAGNGDRASKLPADLSGPERFQSLPLVPLGTPPPGGGLAEAMRSFQAAIEKPLLLTRPDGTPRFGWRFADGDTERLARAFAETRLAQPDAPLTPALQVVLAHLLRQASDGTVRVDGDAGDLINEALENHLHRALEDAFPSVPGSADRVRSRRSRALLALRELATADGQRGDGLPRQELVAALGNGGEEILEQLATPLTRLVVFQADGDATRCVLSHDRMAAAVVRMVEEEGLHGPLLVDAELLALWRFVALKTALYRSEARSAEARSERSATRLPRRFFQQIEEHADVLLRDEKRQAWWAACQRQRQADRKRALTWAAVLTVILTLVGSLAWRWAEERQERLSLLAQISEGEPAAALTALVQLNPEPETEMAAAVLAELQKRQEPMDVLARGLTALDGESRESLGATVLRVVELALPWVEESPEDPVLLANLLWPLDYATGPENVDRASALRQEVLRELRQRRPPDPGALDFVEVEGGSFLMGTPVEALAKDDEKPQHEVTVSSFRLQRHEITNEEYRLLFPEHPGDGRFPATQMTYFEAYTYAAWLGGRLPTEAEWEYAAQAGCPYLYCDRDGEEVDVQDVAWTVLNAVDPETGKHALQPVMQLEPNAWGLFDMLGNAFEWTADWYAPYSGESQQNPWGPPAPVGTGGRTSRGGCYWLEAPLALPAPRRTDGPQYRVDYRSFRVLIDPEMHL